jgi:hypothetical protein
MDAFAAEVEGTLQAWRALTQSWRQQVLQVAA